MFLTRNPLCLQTEDNVRKGTTNSTTSRKWDAKYHNTVKPVLSDHPRGMACTCTYPVVNGRWGDTDIATISPHLILFSASPTALKT